jgi:hypothetical protein
MTYTKTAKSIEQRKQASRKPRVHGAYAYRDNGEAALEPKKRGRLAELTEIIQDKQGVYELLQDRAVKAVLICEILESHIAEQVKQGKKPVEIPALKQLPAFWNSAQRALFSLYNTTPDEQEYLGLAATIIQAVKGNDNG